MTRLELRNCSQVSADFLKCFWPSIAGAIETALRKGAQQIEHFFEMLQNASSVQFMMSGKTYSFVHVRTTVKTIEFVFFCELQQNSKFAACCIK